MGFEWRCNEIGHGFRHVAGKYRSGLLGIALSAMSLAGLVVCSPPASAVAPTGDFAVFSQCPRFTVGPQLCIFAQIAYGEIRMGGKVVPISNTIVLQGGLEAEPEERFFGALDGKTLSRTPLAVPGGLLGIVSEASLSGQPRRLLEASVSTGTTGVVAVTEMLGTPAINRSNLINREGVSLSLPVRIRLQNALLGGECFIGSRSKPVVLNLTTGATNPPAPNQPISGQISEIQAKDEFQFVVVSNVVLVNNSLPVPGATGCGGPYSSVIDAAIDAKLGLPSPAGRNTVILSGGFMQGTNEGVIASEK